jgi:hypothetical protein
MISESMHYSDIDLNLCWVYDEAASDAENYVFSVSPTCDKIPTVIITNETGRYQLQFKKDGSVIELSDNKLWYDKTSLTAMKELS